MVSIVKWKSEDLTNDRVLIQLHLTDEAVDDSVGLAVGYGGARLLGGDADAAVADGAA